MKIGAHIPTGGNYEKMARYAQEVGCECIQIFAKSPRQWNATALPIEKRAELETARNVYDFGSVLTHTSYLINLTTTNKSLYEKSIHALADELVRGSVLNASGVNTHQGNVPDGNRPAAATRAARAIERAFVLAEDTCDSLGIACDTRLILENTAGAGTTFGATVDELCEIIAQADVARQRLGICIDTCHGWAQGYRLDDREGWQTLIDEFIARDSLDCWHFVHANDCKFGCGAHKDRHAWIGEGEIGFEGFRALLHLGKEYSQLEHLCLCTEMPGEMPAKDIINIATLKALREEHSTRNSV